ncbi:unnamed protein product [Ambrosiozyma monospora]|uniref:Unnamed protein product n=1 Tax=Ambrosiozyma monospora TaxID=43982 RepID=A0ACB5T2T6_AMBMO|nr:unnamed protein product [Ambrosiozyma monospora]
MNDLPICTNDNLTSFKERLLAKVNRATTDKIREFQTAVTPIGYKEFGIETPDNEFQHELDCQGQWAASIINFIQSPDETLKYEKSLNYANGQGVGLPIAGSFCFPDGYIYCPSLSGEEPHQKYIIKAFEIKRPFIIRFVNNFPFVPVSKMFIHQVIENCLSTSTTSVDFLDYRSYFVFNFDFRSFSNDNGETLYYKYSQLDVPLAYAMAVSANYNLERLNAIKDTDSENVVETIEELADRAYMPDFDEDPDLGHDGGGFGGNGGGFGGGLGNAYEPLPPRERPASGDLSESNFESPGPRDADYGEPLDNLSYPPSAGSLFEHNSSGIPSTALTSDSTGKQSSRLKQSYKHFETCRELQEAEGKHPNMILAVTYKTSGAYLKYKINPELRIKDEDEVIVKILDLSDISSWFNLQSFYGEAKKYKLKELRENVNNEIAVYKHIWEYNARLDKKDSDRFINIPKLIHYGEASELHLQRLDVRSSTSKLFKKLEASGRPSRRYLYGPYLVLEYLKDMRAPRGKKEHAEVKKELAKLRKIGVSYNDYRSPNFLFDP